MSEPRPLNPETAGQAFQHSVDQLFTACVFNAFSCENEAFLNDLGLAISYGVADGDDFVECIRIANWNNKSILTLERSSSPDAISDGIDDVLVRVTHQDMMGDQIEAPFNVNENPVFVPAMQYALTNIGAIVPYIRVPQGESTVLLAPDLDDCFLSNPETLAHLLDISQLTIFLELYATFDVSSTFVAQTESD